MSKGGGSPPPPPDPTATAAAQGAANKEAILTSAEVNRFNETTPYGSTTWNQASPEQWERTINLSPEGQQQLDTKNQLGDLLGGMAIDRAGQIQTGPFTLDGLPSVPTDIDKSGLPSITNDFSADASHVEQATFDRAKMLMDPEFNLQERRLDTKLANQGLPVGSEAYSGEMDRFGRMRNEAMLATALSSVGAGRAEQSRLFDLASSGRAQGINEQFQDINLARGTRQEALSENLLERTQAINELAALLQGSPALQTPQAPNTAQYQIAPPDIIGLNNMQYQGQLNNYNMQQQNSNAMMGGLFRLGSALIGAPFWG